MATTTIRVDTETHRQLQELSQASGASLLDTVREAAEALRRQRFAATVADEIAALRGDPAAWADYLADQEATSVSPSPPSLLAAAPRSSLDHPPPSARGSRSPS